MAPRPGLEPGTVRLTAECSTIELSWKSGASGQNRTGVKGLQNPRFTIKLRRLTNQLLYNVSVVIRQPEFSTVVIIC